MQKKRRKDIPEKLHERLFSPFHPSPSSSFPRSCRLEQKKFFSLSYLPTHTPQKKRSRLRVAIYAKKKKCTTMSQKSPRSITKFFQDETKMILLKKREKKMSCLLTGCVDDREERHGGVAQPVAGVRARLLGHRRLAVVEAHHLTGGH